MRSVSLVLLLAALPAIAAWKPVEGHISTRWAASVDPARPLPEYPRPQMARSSYFNLNGLWDYAIVDKGASAPARYDGQILVPFPVESSLSGVMKPLTDKQELWYRRPLQPPPLKPNERLLLHFGAVDFEATVYLNGKSLGAHRGGYDGFSFDITGAAAGAELTLRVWDPTAAGAQPRGKQNLPAIANPRGIFYTPCSGIWQTVWMEVVPTGAISALKINPDLDASKVSVTVTAGSPVIQVIALDGARTVARASGKPGEAISLSIPKPRLWTPDTPFLYTLKVIAKNGSASVDSVDSYFGMRKIAVAKDAKGVNRLMLNNKFVFQSGPLDQGFWPDGIYTAPTDEALRYDIEVAKKLGFNMARKHVKIEPERWYYWCDKLGLLVWQDMPGSGTGKGGNREREGARVSDEAATQFETELKAMIDQHVNHPSIVMWVVFNEGWGQYDTARLTAWTKQYDPTRLVNNASGWNDRKVGDVNDMHKYPGPGTPDPEEKRAAVLGEFGGLGLGTPGHTWVEQTWGYRNLPTPEALTRKYLELWRDVWKLREQGLSAAVYTQTTDVETECNGLLTYDRKIVKVDVKQTYDGIVNGKFPPLPTYKTVVPTAKDAALIWRYTTTKPDAGWEAAGFDAAQWKEGPGGFGTNSPGAVSRTPWTSSDIWIRRQFTLPAILPKTLLLSLYHDEDAEVYINGVQAARVRGFNTDWEPIDLPKEAGATLKPGANTIAIHCKQTSGAQYIDAGFVSLE